MGGGANDDVSSVMIDNSCGSPVVAELLRPDGTTLEGPVTIEGGAHSYLSVASATADKLPAVTVVLRVEGVVIWSDDRVALSKEGVEFYVLGSCGADSTCAAGSVGNAITCEAATIQP
jgi:hypothetical protein